MSLGHKRAKSDHRRRRPLTPPVAPFASQVSFDEKSPAELLQLLNDVFAELDKAHKVRTARTEHAHLPSSSSLFPAPSLTAHASLPNARPLP